ncbi:MAG: hypothetical protein KC731_20475, partial [Myxococcales bacterium]|nr:hypothetical protein [Myxococcales bacterium]
MQHLRVGAAGSLLLAALAAASCGDPEEQIVPAVYELCTDGVDGDEDGLVDCDDPDCDAEPACLCGNGVCDMEAGEPTTCPLDCPMGCGDGVCAGPETPALCPADCPDPCGDGVCDPATENQQNCLADCEGVANCGNGVVEGDEECDGLTGLSTCGALNPPRGQGDGLSCSNTCEVVDGCGLAMCSTAGTNTMAYSGTISCADVTNELRWDIFEVPVMAGDCVYIRLDNAGLGNADLRATVFDANGTTFFGGAEDYSELDD